MRTFRDKSLINPAIMTVTTYDIINGVAIPLYTEYPNACEDSILILIKNSENPNPQPQSKQFVINEARKNGWNKILAYYGIYERIGN